MIYSSDKEESILEEFDDYFESVGSKINNDSSEEDIAEFNEVVQQYLEKLQDKLNNSQTE